MTVMYIYIYASTVSHPSSRAIVHGFISPSGFRFRRHCLVAQCFDSQRVLPLSFTIARNGDCLCSPRMVILSGAHSAQSIIFNILFSKIPTCRFFRTFLMKSRGKGDSMKINGKKEFNYKKMVQHLLFSHLYRHVSFHPVCSFDIHLYVFICTYIYNIICIRSVEYIHHLFEFFFSYLQ